MARQLGHVKYKGTIGEIRHFRIKGMTANFAGLKGGAYGDQIKNDPSFVRTLFAVVYILSCVVRHSVFRYVEVIWRSPDFHIQIRY